MGKRILLRSNFFSTYTKLKGLVCKITMDELIDFNFATPTAINKFGLVLEPHLWCYYFKWDDRSTTYMNSRYLVPISINLYISKV